MEEYLYDRTRNFKDIDYVGLTGFCPVYGFTASFQAKNKQLRGDDNYTISTPNGINSLVLTFDVSYDVDEDGAQKIANNLEALSGQNAFVFKTENVIYKDLSGYCDGYSINHLSKGSYKVNTRVVVDEAPNLFNWSGTNFINHDFKEWQTGVDYQQDDVVYSNVTGEKINSFYYCTGEHSSEQSNSPTGSNTAWTQEFYWEPDAGLSTEVKFNVVKFNGAWSQRNKTNDNIAAVPVNYNFTSISKKQLTAMLHFLENKGGYRRFQHQIPSVYNRPKVFICEAWSHSWKTKGSHDVSVQFQEKILGIMPKEVPVGGTIPRKIKNTFDSSFGGEDGGFDEGSLPS